MCIRVLCRPKKTKVRTFFPVIAFFRGTQPDICHNVVNLHLLMRPLRFCLTICYVLARVDRNHQISRHVAAAKRNVTCPCSKALICTDQNKIITSWGIYKFYNKVHFPFSLNNKFPNHTAQSPSHLRRIYIVVPV